MPKPDLTKVYADPAGNAFRDTGKGLARIELVTEGTPQHCLLKRMEGLFEADMCLNVASPSAEWALFGDVLSIPDNEDFLTNVKVYRNGQLLTPGMGESTTFDVYFLDVDEIAFEFSIRPGEVLQIWKNFK